MANGLVWAVCMYLRQHGTTTPLSEFFHPLRLELHGIAQRGAGNSESCPEEQT